MTLRPYAVIAVLLGAILLRGVASPAAERGPEAPIAIDAEQGIEWRQQEKLVIARGNARAIRGDLEVRAEELSARYRERPDGSTEIWRVDASGGVLINSRSETIDADRGTYDLENNVLTVTGDKVRLTSGEAVVTAERQMEYRARSRTLIASGNATARQGKREVRADTLTAYLSDRDDGGGGSRLRRIDAETDVWVLSPGEIMRGDRGSYDLEQGKATLSGSVRITRGENQLNGCRGEMDLDTGVSRLLACTGPDGDGARVKGLIVPGTVGRDRKPAAE
jgi:lipopolysaccharide export system protein LptA